MQWNLLTFATIGLLVSCSGPQSPPEGPAAAASAIGIELSGGPRSTPSSPAPQTEAVSPLAGPVEFHAEHLPTTSPPIPTMPGDSASPDQVARLAATSWATETVASPDQASEASHSRAASVIDSRTIDDGFHARAHVTLEVVDGATGEPQHLVVDVVLRQEGEIWIITSMELAR